MKTCTTRFWKVAPVLSLPWKMGEEIHQTTMPLIKYAYDQALKETTAYFRGDQLAAGVWANKYALKDSAGNLYELTPDHMHRRIAKEIARIEKRYPNPMSEESIFQLLKDFKYIVPQGSPMAGIGNPFQIGSLSNCFVIGNTGNADSYGGIMKVDEEQVQLMKRRGGVGHDLSHIRPKGSPVKNSALTSTGLVPFMERYSNSTREVAQDGRRGALMLSVSVKHPDAEGFIDAKMEQGKVTGANVSVKITDEFMKAVIHGKDFTQQYPINSKEAKYTKTINAQSLWKKIVHNAWRSAEPGILFWDTIIRESVPDCYSDLGFTTVSTNPCGEIPLCPYDSCRLLAINLYRLCEKTFHQQGQL
jgi:ribonucleoside-diphosphate reductase alpha chain